MLKIILCMLMLPSLGLAASSSNVDSPSNRKKVLLQELTLEEKVGQLLMVHFHGEEANEDARILIQDLHVGGVIYYNWANSLHSPQQVRSLSLGLQKLAKIPLLLAVDQEGGLVARLQEGFTIFPGNKALGMTSDVELAEKSAFAIGQELAAVGINMNLAPVADINNNPRNPVIGIRSFGESEEIVSSFAHQAIRGYHRAKIATSLKHFPGHGDVDIDSHQDLPVVKKSLEKLWQGELAPFAHLAHETDTIMTGHLLVPALDPQFCTTLSKKTLDLLRHEIDFQGVVISDSLVMEGILKQCPSIEEAAVRAFDAGCDMLILGGKQLIGTKTQLELTICDIEKLHRALTKAVQTGRITQERLDQSVERILALKERYPSSPSPTMTAAMQADHEALSKEIATLAIKITKNKATFPTPLKQSCLAIFAPSNLQNAINSTPLLRLGSKNVSLFFENLNPSEKERDLAHQQAQHADALIFCSYNAWKYPLQAELIDSLLDTGKPMVLLVLRDPLDASLFPKADWIITTFSPTAPSIRAACDYLHAE